MQHGPNDTVTRRVPLTWRPNQPLTDAERALVDAGDVRIVGDMDIAVRNARRIFDENPGMTSIRVLAKYRDQAYAGRGSDNAHAVVVTRQPRTDR